MPATSTKRFFKKNAAESLTSPGARSGLGWAALALGVTLLSACGKNAPAPAAQPRVAEVGVTVLKQQSQRLDTTLPGRTAAFLSAEVRPQVTGIVQKRLFTEGALVKQGQPLYQLDAASLRAAEASAMAVLAKTEASQRTLEATARRNAELVKITAISQQAFEESQAAVKQSAADVAVAKANLENGRINLRYSRIEAPISGRISLSSVTPGALVTANQTAPLTEIVQMDPMYVNFTQSTAELLRLKNDLAAGRYQALGGEEMSVRIALEDGSEYKHEGKLRFSGLIVNQTMGTVTLRAVFPNPDGVLMPGMYVQAKLPTGLAPDAILLPQRAVSLDLKGRASVLVVKEDSTIEKRFVDLGRAIASDWLVQGGLKDGERVVIDGFQRVKPGDKVKVAESGDGPKTDRKADPQASAAALRAATEKK
ncbi:efflux RND transporter periplasmic adaptor subunit [Ottowia thiooxydans]|uniref:efflux RND transporter periplasmic adaptor subunit n=1 Tax=Ottowia thiooxydans TaxID=219182 RepID=UPI00041905FF|nr:efflux RND transporter periplasmic adaptor subunit [Ottowia thiooxydans]